MINRSIKAGKAFIELFLDDSKAVRELTRFGRRFSTVGRQIATAGAAGIGISGAVIAGIFAPAVKLASDYQETLSKFKVVYGELADAQKLWVDDFAKQVGRSRLELTGFAAEFQDLLVPIGVDQKQAAEVSQALTKLTVDLGSFNNKLDSDVARDLSAALTGSSEVMKKYGVVVNETAVKQELLNRGLNKTNATEAQKALARLDIILRGTTAAQGDAIRTAGGFANRMKAIRASVTNAAVEIGTALLPALTKIADTLQQYAEPAAAFIRSNQVLVVGAGIGVTAIGALSTAALAGGAALTLLGTVASAVATAIGIVGGPVVAATAIIVGAYLATNDWRQSFERLVGYIFDDVLPALQAISNFIEGGDWEQAGELAILSLQIGISKGIVSIERELSEFLSGLADYADVIPGLDSAALRIGGLAGEAAASSLAAGFDLKGLEARQFTLIQQSRVAKQERLDALAEEEAAAKRLANLKVEPKQFLSDGDKAIAQAKQVSAELQKANINEVVKQTDKARSEWQKSLDDWDKGITRATGLKLEPDPESQRQIDQLKSERNRIEKGIAAATIKADAESKDLRVGALTETLSRIDRARNRLDAIGREIADIQAKADPVNRFNDLIETVQRGAETAFDRIRITGTSEGRVAERIDPTAVSRAERIAERQAKAAETSDKRLRKIEENTRNISAGGLEVLT